MRPNRFLLTFSSPSILLTNQNSPRDEMDRESFRDMEYWCRSVNLPGFQLATQQVHRYTYGPDEKRPYMPIFAPITATFYSDANGDLLRFFNAWTQIIMPHDWYNGGINQNSRYGGRQYEMEYKANYATDLFIKVYNTAGDETETYFIKEAFPSQVSDVQFDWNDNGNAFFMVNFEYLDWTTNPNSPGVNPIRNIGQQGSAIGGGAGNGSSSSSAQGPSAGGTNRQGALGIEFPNSGQSTIVPFDYRGR